jgi:hypothetical protein
MTISRILLVAPTLFLTICVPDGEAIAQNVCPDTPGADQVVVYQHARFKGKCTTLGIGEYPNPKSFSPVLNDSISSLKVGINVRIHLFEHGDFNGQVALYEAGSTHDVSFPDSSPFSLGPNVNDTASSIIVQEALGVRVPYIFANDYPRDRETVWSDEAQGMCHTDTHWFVTSNSLRFDPNFNRRARLLKIPLSADLNSYDPSVAVARIPDSLKDGYDHMGDPDCINGFVFVPLEDSRFNYASPPVVAVYRASDLAFVNYGILYMNDDNHAGWVAIDPSSGGAELWASRGNLSHTGTQGIFIYGIDWTQVDPDHYPGFVHPGYVFADAKAAVPLKNRKGHQLSIKTMQGGVFDLTGRVLYLSNSDDKSADGHGIFAFLKSTGDWIGQTTVDYGKFRYETSCCFQEEEGLDFFPTNPAITPGISGELHAILLNNEGFSSDRIWMKHYTQFQSATADLIPISPPGSVQYCKSINGKLQVVIRVENQGGAFAPASITRVDFRPLPSVYMPTAGVRPGGIVDLDPIGLPPGCGHDCAFTITVDSTDTVDEGPAGEANNIAVGNCPG